MKALEAYLRDIQEIRSSGGGVKETSYYPALSNLLNSVGHTLKPRVRCVNILANLGAGNPDFGLFEQSQFRKSGDLQPLEGQVPARGVIEVKPVSDDAWLTAETRQVSKYWQKYRLVLVTNYRDFLLIGEKDGKPERMESFRLAESSAAFWTASAHPLKTAQDGKLGERFEDYLKRVMLHQADLVAPETVAWFLASYARDALHRIEGQDLPALATLRNALEKTLGITFEGDEGDHFFRSSLIQTLFYGLFAAWELWNQHNPKGGTFDWKTAAWDLKIPVIRLLFEQLAVPGQLKPMGLTEPLDWAAATLDRVEYSQFQQRFERSDAVQYFYEPFLEAFDPQLRKSLGVWYTPPEIVKYMVTRVDTVLREELNLPDGLADPNVYVLDPCCGTGAYLVEVLQRIHKTLQDKGADALSAHDVKRAALERVFGFEIMPAPLVISHLQIGLLLQRLRQPLSEKKEERASVYLTNALTGWDPKQKPSEGLPLELANESAAAGEVKRDKPILVILGNPPYNAFYGTGTGEEKDLVKPYKEGLVKDWGIKKFNLDDLYVRFIRMAERRIAERTGRGIVCFISNFSYLGGPAFVVMRQRLLREFDRLWFDSMNGDSRETGKLTPEGLPDPSVFSTEHNREGIRVGTAIMTLARLPEREPKPSVRFRQFWGATKRADLLVSLERENFETAYQRAKPAPENRFSFRPGKVSKDYLEWPKLVDLSAEPPFNGPVERRGMAFIRFPEERKEFRVLEQYLNPKRSDEEIRGIEPRLMLSSGEFKAEKSRQLLIARRVKFDEDKVVNYPFKPMDVRLAYLDSALQPLFSRPAPMLLEHRNPKNAFLISRDTADKSPEGPPFYYSRLVCDYDAVSGHARHFPFMARAVGVHDNAADNQLRIIARGEFEANISQEVRRALQAMKAASGDDTDSQLLWHHVLAIGYSPAYLEENADGIRQDWPRIPLPSKKKDLLDSAELGNQVAALLDTESPVPAVTAGSVRPELKTLGPISRVTGGNLSAEDLKLTVGWGHGGKDGATMPGKGKREERGYTKEEEAAIREGAKTLGLTAKEAFARLGETTYDVYLNGNAYWRNVPRNVWEYYIGGYQVIKKWLSYREYDLLERPLTSEEARYVTEMTRRLAALVLLQTALDANYHRILEHGVWPWPKA